VTLPSPPLIDSREVKLSLVIVVALLLAYAPLARAYLADGRPLFALAQLVVHRSIERMDQFDYLRFAASLAIAVVFFRQVLRLEGSRIEHAALAIALGTLNRTDGLANWSELLDLKFVPSLLLMLIAAAVYQPMLSWY